MKFKNIKDILLIALIGFIIFTQFFSSTDPVIPDPVEVIIPEVSGTVGETIEDVIEAEVPVQDPVTKIVTKIVVDQEYKEKYDKAIKDKDSIAAENIFLKSIEIHEYDKIAIDNDTIKISLYAKTRGELLKYTLGYKIKADTITYIPQVVMQRPKLTVLAGVELVVPLANNIDFNTPVAIKGDNGFQNRKGNIISIGADTQKNVYLGYKHAIKLRNLNPFKKKK